MSHVWHAYLPFPVCNDYNLAQAQVQWKKQKIRKKEELLFIE